LDHEALRAICPSVLPLGGPTQVCMDRSEELRLFGQRVAITELGRDHLELTDTIRLTTPLTVQNSKIQTMPPF